MKRCPTRFRALKSHADRDSAILWAEQVGNVAFIRNGIILTCSRSYVCDCINAGQSLEVLADHDLD